MSNNELFVSGQILEILEALTVLMSRRIIHGLGIHHNNNNNNNNNIQAVEQAVVFQNQKMLRRLSPFLQQLKVELTKKQLYHQPLVTQQRHAKLPQLQLNQLVQ